MSSTKILLLVFVFFISTTVNSQQGNTTTFGKPSYQEITMTSYEKEPEASGVVLYERGDYKFVIINYYIYLEKKVHRKIKVIDASKFNLGTVSLYLYKGRENREKVTKVKALTHNGNLQTYVKKDAYFDINESENWSVKRFTFPNIKDGSVLEYKYTLITPFFFNFGSWDFQGELPKIYSEFNSEIPANYQYNRALFGNLKLKVNEVKIKANCFSIPALSNPADCEITKYVMTDIPTFNEENYMLAKKNYSSRVDFELMTYYDFDGIKHKYSKTWKDVDKEFKYDKDIGKQLNNVKYFEKNMSQDLLIITDDLEKSKKIYTYTQNHFSWNGKSGVFNNSRVKKAYENKTGSSTEINLSLINMLKAANLDAKLILHSTRQFGLPKSSFPVLTDFNYTLVLLTIEEKEYILDATDEYIPFGMVPFRALNIKGRVMDFKKGSYWIPIIPNLKNLDYLSAQLIFEDEETISGNVTEVHTGYKAVDARKKLKIQSEYISDKESISSEIEISDFTIENKEAIEEPLKEKYTVSFNPEIAGTKVYLFPYFLQSQFLENPFKLKERSYMVELGYPISNSYMLTLDLNNLYEVEQLPANKKIKLAGDAGECSVLYSYQNGKINLRFNFRLTDFRFNPEQYQGLKDFFKQVVEIQTKEAIVLKKL